MADSSPTDYAQVDDGELLAMLARPEAPEEAAFVALYRRRQAGLYRFALRMTGSQAAAEDAVQETFLALLRSAAKYDAARGSVSAFLYGIARNCVRRGLERAGGLIAVGLGNGHDEMESLIERATAVRGGSNHATLTASGASGHANDQSHNSPLYASPVPHPLDTLARAEEVDALRRAILALPQHYREAVILCDLEELSYEEAAAALACPVGTVRSRLHRARALLGQRLAAFTAEGSEGTAIQAEAGPSRVERTEVKPDRATRRDAAADAGVGKIARRLECKA